MTATTIHIRYDGQSYEVPKNELDLPENENDANLKEATERWLADNEHVANASLTNFEVEHYPNNNLSVIRPQAKFG